MQETNSQLQELCYLLHQRNVLNGERMSACAKVNYYSTILRNLKVLRLDTPQVRNGKRTMEWAQRAPADEFERCAKELSEHQSDAKRLREHRSYKVAKKWRKAGYRELHTLILKFKAVYAQLKYETAEFTQSTNRRVTTLAKECNVFVQYDNGYIRGLSGKGRMLQTVPFYDRKFIKRQHDEYVANLAVQRMLSDEENQ